MNTLLYRDFESEMAPQHLTAADYCQWFTEEMKRLYLLSFLLTADQEDAEQCFADALSEYVEGACGFTEWVLLLGRRAVLRHAIRIVQPVPGPSYGRWLFTAGESRPSGKNQLFSAITSLEAFERFVFVISVLEGKSEDECCRLLNCAAQDIVIARLLTQRVLADADIRIETGEQTDFCFFTGSLFNQPSGVC
jgi:hypothetical protein